jgi:SAM-dependent methyltransferase
LLEFTGERVVPGLADDNLFNEHLARYRFAARFVERAAAGSAAGPALVLDAGCGAGYGSAEFGESAVVVGIDVAADAVAHARESFGNEHVRFLQAGCEQLPFADGVFDLVAGFEVIEHLERWPEMLSEARRVLKPSGVLLVSTPNKSYYAKSRGDAGPNPFHAHEFEYDEFRAALTAAFAHVQLWTQNHVEGIAFVPRVASGRVLDAPDEMRPDESLFFLAACSMSPIGPTESFAFLPSTGNVLHEREKHISLLTGELEQKTRWLDELNGRHDRLNREHTALLEELKERNLWAERLDADLKKSGARVVELQEELNYRLKWIGDLEAQIGMGNSEIQRLDAEASQLRVAFEERTKWGEEKAAELQRAEAMLAALQSEFDLLHRELVAAAHSKWMRLGHAVHLGPKLRES